MDVSVNEADLRGLREWACKCIYNYGWLASGLVEILCKASDPNVDLRQAAQSHRSLSEEFSAAFLQAAFDIIEIGSHQVSTAVEVPDPKYVITKFTVPPTTTEYEIGKRAFPTAHEAAHWLHDEAATLVDVLESVDFQLVPVQDSEPVWRLAAANGTNGSDAVGKLLLDYQPLDSELVDRLRVGIHEEWRRAVAWLRGQDAAAAGDGSGQATANARMIDTLSRVSESRDWSAAQFADYLRLSKGTIGKTPAWKTLMAARESEKLGRIDRGQAV